MAARPGRLPRADALEEEGQVPALDQRPQGPHRVILRDQLVERAGLNQQLLAIGTPEARRRIQVGGRLRRLGHDRLPRIVWRSCGVAHTYLGYEVRSQKVLRLYQDRQR